MTQGHKSILFLGNSQSTAADLPDDLYGQADFISLLGKEFMRRGIITKRITVSSLDIERINLQFKEYVCLNSPDLVVMQFGIIECAIRILPEHWRSFLAAYSVGRKITRYLHKHKSRLASRFFKWRHAFQDIPLSRFRKNLDSLCHKITSSGMRCCFIKIPLLSDECQLVHLPRHNEIIDEYNLGLTAICEEYSIPVLDVQDDFLTSGGALSEFFVGSTVHFSRLGHMAAHHSLLPVLTSLLDRGVAVGGSILEDLHNSNNEWPPEVQGSPNKNFLLNSTGEV